jgi:uncharacterized alkaline shock family protein YloU
MPDSSHNPIPVKGATADVHSDASGIRGTVRIAPAVLIELIELTVQGIEGIDGLRTHRNVQALPSSPGARTFDNGKVAVTIGGDQIDATIALGIERGTNVSELSAEVQKRIGFAVGNMLGMTVRSVDIYIEEIVSGPHSS